MSEKLKSTVEKNWYRFGIGFFSVWPIDEALYNLFYNFACKKVNAYTCSNVLLAYSVPDIQICI